jgi:hypothetical protein
MGFQLFLRRLPLTTPKLVLYQADNGFIIKDSSGLTVFESPQMFCDSDGHCVASKKEVLWYIIEWMGNGTRYSSERLKVIIEPGDKYEEGTEDAEV